MSNTTQQHDHDHGHTGGHSTGHHGPRSFLTKYVFSTDHKIIGIQFMLVSLLFVLIGGLLALAVRYQLAWPSQNVPYAFLLPGKEGSAVKMTSRAPEGNPGLWLNGGPVELRTDLEAQGYKIPAGAMGRFTGFADGQIAVVIPAGTRIREAGSSPSRTLTEPVDALIAINHVLGDDDYSKQAVRAAAGTDFTAAGMPGSNAVTMTITGSEIFEPDPDSPSGEAKPKARQSTDSVLLPVRVDQTQVSVGFPAVVVDKDGRQLARFDSPSAINAVSADKISYIKQTLTTDAYLQLFTMHASVMIFFVIIPMLVGGFGNFCVPLMVGARDMAFPRLNMLSYWLSVPAGILMLASFWLPGGAAGGGWTAYPTFSEAKYSANLGTTLWIVSVGLIGFSSVIGALNYITTIVNMRAPGMSMFRMPLTVWSIFITAVLALFATPVLTAAMVLLLLDRTLGTHFFTPEAGGQPIMFQHLFWFYSHPAVYIMILPAMGVTSDVLSTFSRKPIFGYKPMVFAICGIAGLGFIVWGHHMFQSGMNPTLGMTFSLATILIAVPSAIKTFNWLGTLWGGNIRFTPAMLNALGFVSMFVIGGLSGVFMASAPVDIHIHDTYFIVAHIHYVLFGGSIFGIFAGIYYWFPKMFGRQLNQRWGAIHFILTFIAYNGTFFLMHILGIGGAPRRYFSHIENPTLIHLQPLNVVMTIFAMMLGMAQLPFLYNFFVSLPRKLGRAMIAFFIVMLTAPMVIGLTFWGGITKAGPWTCGSLAHSLWGQTEAGFSQNQIWAGYILLLAALLFLLIVTFKQLPFGGIIGSLVVLGPAIFSILWLMNKTRSGLTIEGSALATAQNIYVSIGLSVIYIVAVVVFVWIVWAIGGLIAMPQMLQRLLYIVFLPAFLAPLVLKKDPYFWTGDLLGNANIISLFDHRWLLLALTALPGLIYLLALRPRDVFGSPVAENPWHANSLEWQTSSPPPHENFTAIPTVHRGPYEYSSPAVEEDYLPQPKVLPPGVVEPIPH